MNTLAELTFLMDKCDRVVNRMKNDVVEHKGKLGDKITECEMGKEKEKLEAIELNIDELIERLEKVAESIEFVEWRIELSECE